MAEYTLEQIDSLPEEILDVLYDAETDEKYRTEIFPLLDEEQGGQIGRLLLDAYFGVVKPAEFPGKVKDIVPDEALRKEILPKILGYSLLPVADRLDSDVKTLI